VDALPVTAKDVAPRITEPTAVVDALPVIAMDVAPRLTDPTAVVEELPVIAVDTAATTVPTLPVATVPSS
jgi:hypothetical protein